MSRSDQVLSNNDAAFIWTGPKRLTGSCATGCRGLGRGRRAACAASAGVGPLDTAREAGTPRAGGAAAAAGGAGAGAGTSSAAGGTAGKAVAAAEAVATAAAPEPKPEPLVLGAVLAVGLWALTASPAAEAAWRAERRTLGAVGGEGGAAGAPAHPPPAPAPSAPSAAGAPVKPASASAPSARALIYGGAAATLAAAAAAPAAALFLARFSFFVALAPSFSLVPAGSTSVPCSLAAPAGRAAKASSSLCHGSCCPCDSCGGPCCSSAAAL